MSNYPVSAQNVRVLPDREFLRGGGGSGYSLVYMMGTTTPLDGGQGFFELSPTDFSTPDNGTTCIVDNNNRRWFLTTVVTSAQIANALASPALTATEARLADANLGVFYTIAASAVAVPLTGSTSETAFATISIPAGAMGANGILRVTTLWSVSLNNANAKTPRVRLGGIGGTVYGSTGMASVLSWQTQVLIRNRGAQNSQVAASNGTNVFTSASSAPATSSVDMSVAQDLVFTGQLATGTDTLTLESYIVEILYKA